MLLLAMLGGMRMQKERGRCRGRRMRGMDCLPRPLWLLKHVAEVVVEATVEAGFRHSLAGLKAKVEVGGGCRFDR